MSLETFIQAMPKVELHVHLEGSIPVQTLFRLAQRNKVELPATTPAELQEWYTFKDFKHFIQVYLTLSNCIRTPTDIEEVARAFLSEQAAQNIRYSEVTYTAFNHYHFKQIPFAEQLAALNRARAWGEAEYGIKMNFIIDIPRSIPAEKGPMIADWAISGQGNGVVALGLGGPEANNPPEKFKTAFERAQAAGLPSVPHAGEMAGPESIWGALRLLNAVRLGHGVRCLEDPTLVAELRARQIPLEICPTSNICLGIFPSFATHPLPYLLAEKLYLTLNADDPSLFNTTLTAEYSKVAQNFHLDAKDLEKLVFNALRASFLPSALRFELEEQFQTEFAQLRATHLAA